MDSLSELKKVAEAGNGRANADNLHDILRQRPDLLGPMVDIFLSNAEPSARRIIWAIDLYAEENPDAILPYLNAFAAHLPHAVHDAHKRHTLRILGRYNLPEETMGLVLSACFDYLSDPIEPPAIKVYAMEIVFNACRTMPDIRQELIDTIEFRIQEQSPGFQARAAKILKQLSRSCH